MWIFLGGFICGVVALSVFALIYNNRKKVKSAILTVTTVTL